jgi:hypothetical protein
MVTNPYPALTALATEVESLSRQLESVSCKLRELLAGYEADPVGDTGDRPHRYLTPGFTHQLIEHLHRAKRQALSSGPDEERHAPAS